MHEGGNHADELQGGIGCIAELVEFVRWNVEHITGFQGLLAAVAKNHPLAGGDKDFMFIVVLMFGRATAWRNRKAPHGKVGTTLIRPAQHLHLHALGACHRDILLRNRCKVFNDHVPIRARAAGKEKRTIFSKMVDPSFQYQ